jgi:hypothetical protein
MSGIYIIIFLMKILWNRFMVPVDRVYGTTA